MKDDLRKIADKNFSSIVDYIDREDAPLNMLPNIMVELCKNLNTFYQLNSYLSFTQFESLLEAYLETLNEIQKETF